MACYVSSAGNTARGTGESKRVTDDHFILLKLVIGRSEIITEIVTHGMCDSTVGPPKCFVLTSAENDGRHKTSHQSRVQFSEPRVPIFKHTIFLQLFECAKKRSIKISETLLKTKLSLVTK